MSHLPKPAEPALAAPRLAASQTPALAALLLGALAMGMSPTFVRLADVGPFASAFWRVALALPALYGWMRASERERGLPRPRAFTVPVVLSGLAFAGDLIFWHLAIVKTSVANATFFATCAPLWVVVFGWTWFGERVSRALLCGLGLCLCGGVALVAQSLNAAPGHVVGDLFGVATGLFFGLYFLTVRAARASIGAARVTFELSVVTAAVLLVAAAVMERQLLPLSPAGWAALVVLALVSHAGGQGLLSFALGVLPAVFSSLVIFLEAVFAAAIAWLVLGEAVTPAQALGGVFIIAGIAVARPREVVQPTNN